VLVEASRQAEGAVEGEAKRLNRLGLGWRYRTDTRDAERLSKAHAGDHSVVDPLRV
ncbi:MAG: hypothetical protein RL243_857, partial [Actinomycetota bacterium]